MATDNETKNLGFVLPMGWDDIKQGDNAITQNAKAAVDLYRSTLQTIDSKITKRAAELRTFITANGNGTLSISSNTLSQTTTPGNGTATIGDLA